MKIGFLSTTTHCHAWTYLFHIYCTLPHWMAIALFAAQPLSPIVFNWSKMMHSAETMAIMHETSNHPLSETMSALLRASKCLLSCGFIAFYSPAPNDNIIYIKCNQWIAVKCCSAVKSTFSVAPIIAAIQQVGRKYYHLNAFDGIFCVNCIASVHFKCWPM